MKFSFLLLYNLFVFCSYINWRKNFFKTQFLTLKSTLFVVLISNKNSQFFPMNIIKYRLKGSVKIMVKNVRKLWEKL